MADDAAVLIGVGAIVVVGFGIFLISRQRALAGGGGGLFGDGFGLGGGLGGCITSAATASLPHDGRIVQVCNDPGGTQCAAGYRTCILGNCGGAPRSLCYCGSVSESQLHNDFVSRGCGTGGGGSGGTSGGCPCPSGGSCCDHLNCAGVRACIGQCPRFSTAVLNSCGVQNIGGSIITPGSGATGGRPTTGGAIIPCIVDEATRRSKCGNLCSCSAAWFFQGTNQPCSPTGAEVAARADQCAGRPAFDISAGNANNPVGSAFVHRPLYNRVFYNPNDQMRLVVAS